MTHPCARRRAALAALFSGLLLAGSLLVGLPASAANGAPRPLIDLIHVENGTKDTLDGGDFTAIVVGNRQFIGVQYGSAEHPLSAVTLFTVFPRFLGTATVVDRESGHVVAHSSTLPILTLVAQRLDAALEFRDVNGDGIFNFRPNFETRDPFDFNASEPLMKGAHLAGDWNLTGFEMSAVSDDEVHVDLVLSLNDTAYRLPFDHPAGGDGRLNKVEFTIHIAITREHVVSQDVPHFAAEVGRVGGERHLVSLVPAGTASGSYWSTRALFKVDHDLVGWDFAAPRESIESKLLLHTTLVYMNAVDDRLAPWLSDIALGNGREGAANVTAGDTNVTVNSTRPLSEFHEADGVGLRDHWHRVGGLGWVPTASLWPTEQSTAPETVRVRFQILGGTRMEAPFNDHVFRGFVLSGGYVYPAGYRIYHDPQLETSSVELEGSSALPGVLPALILVGEAALILAGVVAILIVAAQSTSKASRARAAAEAARLEALKARYKLPEAGDPPRRGVA